MHEQSLQEVLDQLRPLVDRYGSPTTMPARPLGGDDSSKARALLHEAKAVMDEAIGGLNEFSTVIFMILNAASIRFSDQPTKGALQEGIAAIEGGIRAIRRKTSRTATVQGKLAKPWYVAPSRVLELQSINVGSWDTKRLVRMLEELNAAHANDLHTATAMLVRAIADHVPPIFGVQSFAEVANNVSGKSISGSLKNLQNSLRNIADGQLHAPIRKCEVLPSESQVDFHQDLDVLLQEILRVLRL
ncbi:MAG: hypothetical protein ABIZ09_00010 [Rhodoferax sp.]